MKAAFKGLHLSGCFPSQRRACPVLKHSQVSEVLRSKKLRFKNVSLLSALKIIRKSAQICDRCSLEHFAMLSRFHSRGRTHDAGSVTQIAVKYKLTGFLINFFKNDFSVLYFVFVYS